MAAYTPVSVSRAAGADLTVAGTAVSASSDTFPPGPSNYLRVKNAGGTACTVSVMAASTVAGPSGTFLAPLNLAPNVGITTGDRLFGPFPAYPFADPSDGLVHPTYGVSSSVTVAVYNMSAQ